MKIAIVDSTGPPVVYIVSGFSNGKITYRQCFREEEEAIQAARNFEGEVKEYPLPSNGEFYSSWDCGYLRENSILFI